ncbi:hypothetical protein C8Q77DRAFT_492019 [Trametes polyzona]|nr:hypothetical protein C8Q77DRAFT_492019 [Trametes polyzona]
MILTTLFATCFFALLGALHSDISIDTLFASLSHLRIPSLASIGTILQLADSPKYLPLGIALLLKEVDLNEGLGHQLSAPSPIPSLYLPASSLPELHGSSHQAAQCLIIKVFAGVVAVLSILTACLLVSHRIREYPRSAKSHYNCCSVQYRTVLPPTCGPIHPCAGPLEAHSATRPGDVLLSQHDQHVSSTNAPCHPLGHINRPTVGKMKLPCVPISVFAPTSTGISDRTGTDNSPRVFGHPLEHSLCNPSLSNADEEQLDNYLRVALNIPHENAPPLKGWCANNVPLAWRPPRLELDSWIFPRLYLESSLSNAASPAFPCIQTPASMVSSQFRGLDAPSLPNAPPFSDDVQYSTDEEEVDHLSYIRNIPSAGVPSIKEGGCRDDDGSCERGSTLAPTP